VVIAHATCRKLVAARELETTFWSNLLVFSIDLPQVIGGLPPHVSQVSCFFAYQVILNLGIATFLASFAYLSERKIDARIIVHKPFRASRLHKDCLVTRADVYSCGFSGYGTTHQMRGNMVCGNWLFGCDDCATCRGVSKARQNDKEKGTRQTRHLKPTTCEDLLKAT